MYRETGIYDQPTSGEEMKFKTLLRKYEQWREDAGFNKRKKRWNNKYTEFYRPIFKYFADWDLRKITPTAIDNYRTKRLKEGKSIRTVNHEVRALRRVFDRAIFWGLIDRNPARLVRSYKEPPPKIAYLSPVQEQSLFKAIMEEDPFYRALFLFGFHLALRKNEVLSLRWENIDFYRGILIIRREKAHHTQLLPLSEELYDALSELRRQRPDTDWIFENKQTGAPIGEFRKSWMRVKRKAGIPADFRFHDLRHHIGTKLVLSGVSPYHVAAFLGHTDIRSSNRYIHGSLLNDFRDFRSYMGPGSTAVSAPGSHPGGPRFESWPGHHNVPIGRHYPDKDPENIFKHHNSDDKNSNSQIPDKTKKNVGRI